MQELGFCSAKKKMHCEKIFCNAKNMYFAMQNVNLVIPRLLTPRYGETDTTIEDAFWHNQSYAKRAAKRI